MGENTEQTTNRKTETTAQMNELNKALLELKKITGISLEVSGAAPEQIEPALTQIHCLCTAYKEKYNRTDFLQGLMTGNIPHYEISDRASRLHIDPEEKRILFLIEGKHFDETSGAILKNLLSCRSKTYIVPLTETLLAVIRPLCQNETFEDMRHIAETIVDTQYRGAYPCPPLIQFCNEHACRYSKSFSGNESCVESRKALLFRTKYFPV